jgi:hypothetical protein
MGAYPCQAGATHVFCRLRTSLGDQMRSLFSLPAIAWLLLPVIAAVPPHASAQDIFVTPVANAPFSGVVHVERARILHDGAIVNSKSIRNIGRDSRGRIHNESRMLVPASDTKTPRLIRIHLYDPQTRISAYLDPQERTFWTKTVNHPPSAVPPTIRYASPPGDALPQNEFTKQEDLGIHEMEGLPVQSSRDSDGPGRKRHR